jgi:hypothetical protein
MSWMNEKVGNSLEKWRRSQAYPVEFLSFVTVADDGRALLSLRLCSSQFCGEDAIRIQNKNPISQLQIKLQNEFLNSFFAFDIFPPPPHQHESSYPIINSIMSQ